MQVDPVAEWRRLTEHYRQMSDVQLEELARDFADLTDAAQQVLRGELRHRGLQLPGSGAPHAAVQTNRAPSTQPRAPAPAPANQAGMADAVEPDAELIEYTWKTLLCECEEWEQIDQLHEMLRRAGIESWAEGTASTGDGGLLYPRILVAADQLDEARTVIARPVPQDVIDASRETVPDYEPPRCPACRTLDPILEDADPVNSWLCTACGRRWSDPAPPTEGSAGQAVS